MWGIEHTCMAIIAPCAILACLLITRSHIDAFGAALTQIPFWVGSLVYFEYENDPLYVNMFTDVLAAGALVFLAHLTGRNQFAWLCVVCVGMVLVDVFMGFTEMPFYLELHEGLHYTALAVAVGGNYVRFLSLHPRVVLHSAFAK